MSSSFQNDSMENSVGAASPNTTSIAATIDSPSCNPTSSPNFLNSTSSNDDEMLSHDYEDNSSSYDDDDDDEVSEDDSNHLPFFADATLDLAEAQGIAPTPDLTIKKHVTTSGKTIMARLTVPNLSTISSTSIGSAGAATGGISNITDASATVPINNGNQEPANGHFISNEINDINSNSEHNRDDIPMETDKRSPTADVQDSPGISSSPATTQRNSNIIAPTSTSNFTINAIHSTASTTDNNVAISTHNQPTYRSRPPRRSRDTKWTTTFLLSLPFIFLPSLFHHHTTEQHTSYVQSSKIPLIITTIIAILFARIFYTSRGGGEGEDQRYLTSQILIVSNISTCLILPLLTLTFYNLKISTQIYNLIVMGLAYLTARDIYIFAKLFQSNRSWMREGVNDGERAFYRMMVDASLDILSRSLRSKSFYRVVVFILGIQMMFCLFFKSVLEHALESHVAGEGLSVGKYLWLGIVGLGGYWVVNVLIRLLGYLACGGVTAWFAQQSGMMEDMERMRRSEVEEGRAGSQREGDGLEGYEQRRSENEAESVHEESMPEAYRAVDASAYSLGIEFDEGMDDDYGDEDGMLMGPSNSHDSIANQNGIQTGSRSSTWGSSHNNTSTVKSFLKSALGVSFGSIVHCALLGGAASFAWSMLNMIDWITTSSLRFAPLQQGTFRDMRVGDEGDGDGSLRHTLLVKWQRFISSSRAFVRNHNDLALCHVAAYYKSYTRAANDVMILVDTSGKCGIEWCRKELLYGYICA